MYYTVQSIKDMVRAAERENDTKTIKTLSDLIPDSEIKKVFDMRHIDRMKWSGIKNRMFISKNTGERREHHAFAFIARKLNRIVETGGETGLKPELENREFTKSDHFIDYHRFGVFMDSPDVIKGCLSCDLPACVNCGGSQRARRKQYSRYNSEDGKYIYQIHPVTGEILGKFNTVKEAREATNARRIYRVLEGTLLTSGGFKWAWMDEKEAGL